MYVHFSITFQQGSRNSRLKKKTPISLSLFLKGSQLNFPKDAASLLFACKRCMGLGHSMIRRQQKKSGVVPHFLVIQPAKNVFWITQGVREQRSINLMQRTYSCLLMERSSSHNTHTHSENPVGIQSLV